MRRLISHTRTSVAHNAMWSRLYPFSIGKILELRVDGHGIAIASNADANNAVIMEAKIENSATHDCDHGESKIPPQQKNTTKRPDSGLSTDYLKKTLNRCVTLKMDVALFVNAKRRGYSSITAIREGTSGHFSVRRAILFLAGTRERQTQFFCSKNTSLYTRDEDSADVLLEIANR